MSIHDTPQRTVRDILPNTKQTKKLLDRLKTETVLIRLEVDGTNLGYRPVYSELPDEDAKPAFVGKKFDLFPPESGDFVTGG